MYSHCSPVGQDLLVPGLGGTADALLQLTAILQLLLPLLSILQLCTQHGNTQNSLVSASFTTAVKLQSPEFLWQKAFEAVELKKHIDFFVK